MADSSTTTAPILNLIAGYCWAQRHLRSGMKYVSVASILRKSLTLVRVVFTMQVPWRSQNSMAYPSPTTAPILDLIAQHCWARRRLRSGMKYVSVASILRKSLTLVRVVFTMQVPWRSQNSMASPSTTTAPILDLIAQDCWARRQLRAGIRYVPRRQFPIEL